MTSKTIDGVSRELLERLANKAEVFDDGSDGADAESARSVAKELRALLAAPVIEPLIVPLSGPKEWLDSHRATQEALRQSEPVYQVAARLDSTKSAWIDVDKESFDDYAARGNSWLTRTLYISQPAPLSPDHSGVTVVSHWSDFGCVNLRVNGVLRMYVESCMPDHSGGRAGVVLPEGWKAVPIEPTELMIRRGDQNYSWSVAKIYKAMIEDAPSLDKVKELNQ